MASEHVNRETEASSSECEVLATPHLESTEASTESAGAQEDGGSVCQFFLKGKCRFGHKCRFSHSDLSKDDLEAVCTEDQWEKKDKQKKVNKAAKHETKGFSGLSVSHIFHSCLFLREL